MQHVEKPARAVKRENRRAGRHQQKIGGGQDIGQRIPQLPAPALHPPDWNLKLGAVQIDLRPDQINVRPIGASCRMAHAPA